MDEQQIAFEPIEEVVCTNKENNNKEGTEDKKEEEMAEVEAPDGGWGYVVIVACFIISVCTQ